MFDIENNSDTNSELITEYDYILKNMLDYFKNDEVVK
jgi:exo-beta-1,3-glucanase (GH17 family)